MDQEIHSGYKLFPINYIAFDRLQGNNTNQEHYTDADIRRTDEYLKGQLAKIKLDNKDEAFLTERMLTMYANPVKNYLAAQS
jgi:hypothetical protein